MHVAQAEPSSSFLEQAPTFASQLGVEPTFATSFDEQYGEPFEPTSPRLHRRASTSSLVLQPVLDTSAFSPPALAVDTLGTSAVAAADTMADSASLDTSIYLVDEQWQPSSAGTPGRSRSVTHAARLENPTGGLNLAAPPAAHTQSSYLPVRFAARQVGQSVTQRPAPPPQQQQQQQQQQQRARAEHPPPRPAPQRQLEQSRHAPHYVEESQTGEQRFVPLQRAPKPARPIGRAVEPDFPLAEPLRRRAEQVHAVEEQLHVAREQPHPVVEPDQRRLEPVEEYDPTRPQLDDIRLSLPPPPPSVSRLHQRRNAIVATPPTPQPEEPPAFVIINGQRYELARASSPPPDPRFAPTIETRSSFEGATQAMASLSSARAARCPQAGVEPCRTDPSHAHGHPPPPGPSSTRRTIASRAARASSTRRRRRRTMSSPASACRLGRSRARPSGPTTSSPSSSRAHRLARASSSSERMQVRTQDRAQGRARRHRRTRSTPRRRRATSRTRPTSTRTRPSHLRRTSTVLRDTSARLAPRAPTSGAGRDLRAASALQAARRRRFPRRRTRRPSRRRASSTVASTRASGRRRSCRSKASSPPRSAASRRRRSSRFARRGSRERPKARCKEQGCRSASRGRLRPWSGSGSAWGSVAVVVAGFVEEGLAFVSRRAVRA